MPTKANNNVLNLVSPPIDDMVLLQGTLDDVVIGSHVPKIGVFTNITNTSLASPLMGAPAGLLTPVYIGAGLVLTGNVLSVVTPPPPPPSGYGEGAYGEGLYGAF
jgi:hypothetical protein